MSVDEHDLRLGVLELLRRADTREASAEDEDAWTIVRHQPANLISYLAIFPSRTVSSIRRSRV